MEYFIENFENEKICVRVDIPENNKEHKLSFVCHGITGYKEQEVILQTIEALKSQGYIVVSFDFRNSRGKSFNNNQCASLTSFCYDLEIVISWAKKQSFFSTPFILAGHSLGGSVAINYAINNPKSVSGLILISSIFSGQELLENTQKYNNDFLQLLKNDGVIRSRGILNCYLDFGYLQDLQKYNFHDSIKNFPSPILMITGDRDTSSSLVNNRDFFEKINSYKELHVLENCSHLYETTANQNDLDRIIKKFLNNI